MFTGDDKIASKSPISKSLTKSCRCKCNCNFKSNRLTKSSRKKYHPPFNSGVSINVKLGMHPKLTINYSDAPPPGTYDINSRNKKFTHVTDWRREEALKEFSATMGGKLIDKYIIQHQLMKFGLGPGSHDLKQWPEIFFHQHYSGQTGITSFGVGPRFKGSSRTKGTPGPGYTGKNHNPYYYIEKNRFKSYSNIPTFEFDGLLPRFKSPSKNWSIACNRYKTQHPECLDKILNKVTGRRGPYDLFTGPRDATSLRGYQSQKKSIDTNNWPIKLATEFEKIFSGSNRHKGIWGHCPRFTKKPTVRSMLEDVSLCYKDPDSPGPGFYDPVSPDKSMSEDLHPFNDSVKNARPLRPYDISPGPGTYDLKNDRGINNIRGNGWTSVFKSKVERRIGPKPDEYNSF